MPDRGGKPPRPGWIDRFFAAYEDTHLIGESCKAAGVSRGYVWKYRRDNEEFRTRFEDAEEHSTEVLEQIAVQRAASGSDVLLMFILKSRRPDTYRENVRHEHSVDGQITLALPDGAQPVEIPAQNRREAARLLLQSGDEVTDADVVEEDAA